MQKSKWNLDNSYIKLPSVFYTKQLPVSVRDCKMIVFNQALADFLNVPLQPEIFAGNKIPDGANPIAQAYAGHQFGYFTMLGDGRAVLLGEQAASTGQRFDIQLKGSGRTQYSRGGDGRAALKPMLREYLISEAMYALGIPTTRSLAVAETGETVVRDKNLKGAVLTRVASSHIRVGTFEFASRFCTESELRCLADYTIMRHFQNIATLENKYLLMIKEVAKRQAMLIAKWQLVGFIHGVMNTDNMAISGETIDYGPCAFMDIYNTNTVFSSIDTHGRYSYKNQPKIAAWNLARFAESLLPLFNDRFKAVRLLQEEIDGFKHLHLRCWIEGMRGKLGLFNEEDDDELLINDFLRMMQQHNADYTNTFKALTSGKNDSALFAVLEFNDWHQRWQARLGRQAESKEDVKLLMKSHNPSVIPRNYQVEKALESAEKGDISDFNKFLGVLSKPYDYSSEQEMYSEVDLTTTRLYQIFCGT